MNRHLLYVAILVAAFLPRAAAAQGQPTMYGPSIVAEQAKTIAAAAIAEARKNQWTMAIAIVDTAGDLVYFERMDHTQVGSVDVAHCQSAIGGQIQAADQGVSGRARRRWRGLANPVARGRGGGRRRHAADVRRQDRRRDWRIRRHESAGRRHRRRGSSDAEMKT